MKLLYVSLFVVAATANMMHLMQLVTDTTDLVHQVHNPKHRPARRLSSNSSNVTKCELEHGLSATCQTAAESLTNGFSTSDASKWGATELDPLCSGSPSCIDSYIKLINDDAYWTCL